MEGIQKIHEGNVSRRCGACAARPVFGYEELHHRFRKDEKKHAVSFLLKKRRKFVMILSEIWLFRLSGSGYN